MTGYEQLYLAIVLATFGLFGLTVGYASWRETRNGRFEGIRAPNSPRPIEVTHAHPATA
jgi:hypothetical protein